MHVYNIILKSKIEKNAFLLKHMGIFYFLRFALGNWQSVRMEINEQNRQFIKILSASLYWLMFEIKIKLWENNIHNLNF